MALASGVLTAIYTALIITALIVSITLMLSLTLKPMVFIAIFAFYMCGCTGYLFAYLIMKKKELDPAPGGDAKYTVADYMCLFNLVLCLFVFVMCFIIPAVNRRNLAIAAMGASAYRPPIVPYL